MIYDHMKLNAWSTLYVKKHDHKDLGDPAIAYNLNKFKQVLKNTFRIFITRAGNP